MRNWTTGSRSTSAKYRACEAIAHAFAEAPQAARYALRDKSLVDWLRRSYGDVELAERVAFLINLDSKGEASGSLLSDEELALVCLALDPEGPIRYRGSAIMPDGVGPALASAMMNERNDELKTIAQLIERGPLITAIERSELFAKQDPRLSAARSHQAYLKFPDDEQGLERVVYELNPGLPCLSPLVRDHTVTNLSELVVALGGVVGAGDVPKSRPRDRHVAAFAMELMTSAQVQAVRNGSGRVPLGAQECMTDLAFFAAIQRSEKTGSLRGIARWVRSRLEPALDSFHRQSRRQRVAAELNHAVSSGDLVGMLKILRSVAERNADILEYNNARARYLYLSREENRLSGLLGNYSQLATYRGRQAAAAVGLAVFLVVCVLTVSGGF